MRSISGPLRRKKQTNYFKIIESAWADKHHPTVLYIHPQVYTSVTYTIGTYTNSTLTNSPNSTNNSTISAYINIT